MAHEYDPKRQLTEEEAKTAVEAIDGQGDNDQEKLRKALELPDNVFITDTGKDGGKPTGFTE